MQSICTVDAEKAVGNPTTHPAHSAPPVTDPLLRLPAVLAVLGVGRSTLYDWMARGIFPKPIKLGTKVSAWRRSAIENFIAARG